MLSVGSAPTESRKITGISAFYSKRTHQKRENGATERGRCYFEELIAPYQAESVTRVH